MAKAPDGSFWVAHRGDRVRESAVDEADGAGGGARVPKATAQLEALAPIMGPTLLRVEADTGRVMQAWINPLHSCYKAVWRQTFASAARRMPLSYRNPLNQMPAPCLINVRFGIPIFGGVGSRVCHPTTDEGAAAPAGVGSGSAGHATRPCHGRDGRRMGH